MRRNAGTNFFTSNTFTDGDPIAAVPASTIASDWLNIIQEEIAHVVEGAGLTVDQSDAYPTNNTSQLLAAIQALSGGGGGGGFTWTSVEGFAPGDLVENNVKALTFDAGVGQQVAAFLKIPQGYQTGKQISLFISLYSTSATGTVLFTATATLIRKNSDLVTSTTNQHVSVNTALTNASANQYRQTQLDLTDSTGHVNGVAVSAGDMLLVSLTRGTDLDTTSVRLVPGATEPKFNG